MRKVVLYQLLSLDGVAESPENFILEFDDSMEEHLKQVIDAQDTVILGRRMYDEWSQYWPNSTDEPFASFINHVAKHVVSSTPLENTWENSTWTPSTPEELVTSLRNESGADIGIHGSVTLSQTLLAKGLVDELRLVIAPAVVISGRRLFDGTTRSRFNVTRNFTSPSGHIVLDLQKM